MLTNIWVNSSGEGFSRPRVVAMPDDTPIMPSVAPMRAVDWEDRPVREPTQHSEAPRYAMLCTSGYAPP